MLKLLFLFLISFYFCLAHEEVVLVENNNILTKDEKQYLKNKKELKICIDPNWYPFEAFNKDGKYTGISSEYFKIFEQRLNISIKPIKTDSWSQTLEYVKNRKCDILTLANETPKRKEYLNFTKPYLNIPFVLVTKENIDFIYDFHSLKDKKIGIVKNSALIEILNKKYPNLILTNVKNTTDGINKVQNNKLFGYIGNMLSVTHSLKVNFITNLKIMSKIDDEQSKLAVGIRNDDIILLKIFNKLVSNISNQDKQKILDNYITVKYTGIRDFKYLKYLLIIVLIVILIFIYIQFKLKQQNKILQIKMKKEIEKNRQKEQLYLTQSRLAQTGELLSMIAHQWRQPLGAISATTSFLKYNIELDDFNKNNFLKELNDIENYTQILTNIISDFKDFYKPNKSAVTLNISYILDKALYIIKHSLKDNNIKIICNYNSTKELSMYENELMQVFLNIFKNAQDKFNEEQKKEKIITIKTDDIDDYVIIKIYDNGKTIDDDILPSIFDPYFSTKTNENGTGLGLYMSKIIIEEHHKGIIEVINTKDGVCFSVKLKMGGVISNESI